MLGRLEHVDVAGLVAPRALFVESGSEDVLFPAEVATVGVASLQPIWEALGAPPGALSHAVFEGEHRWNGAELEAFLSRHLEGAP
jgi:hypothetical protein